MLKVIPTLSEGAELWLVLIGGLAIGLGWLLVYVTVLQRALLF